MTWWMWLIIVGYALGVVFEVGLYAGWWRVP